MLFNFLLAASSFVLISPQAVLHRYEEAALATRLGFMTEGEWPSACLCSFYPRVESFRYAGELGITEAQEQQLDRLSYSDARAQRLALALAVLNDAQRARLDSFVQLLRESLRLGLIRHGAAAECLCH